MLECDATQDNNDAKCVNGVVTNIQWGHDLRNKYKMRFFLSSLTVSFIKLCIEQLDPRGSGVFVSEWVWLHRGLSWTFRSQWNGNQPPMFKQLLREIFPV